MSGDHYTVKRIDNYWKMGADGKPLPYVDTVVYRLMTDDAVRTLELRSGNIDINEEIFPRISPLSRAAPIASSLICRGSPGHMPWPLIWSPARSPRT